jgi:Fibronectin type III domain
MRVAIDFNNDKDTELVIFFRNVYRHMKNNPRVPKPPVDLEVFIAKVNEYDAAITAAVDGGKRAISRRNKLRQEAIFLATQLGHYVSAVCDDSEAVYSTGWEPAFQYRLLAKALPTPRLDHAERGPNTGTAAVQIEPISRKHGRTAYYEIRYAPTDGNGQLTGEYLTHPSAVARFPIIIKNLKPGTYYVFQVRAFNKLGPTDWSSPVTFLCA